MIPVWLFLLHISAYLSIGLLASAKIAKRHFIPRQFIVTGAFGFVAILYYVLFFVTLVNPTLGKATNMLFCIVGWGIALYSLAHCRRLFKQKNIAVYIALPLVIMTILMSYYVVVLSSCRMTILNSKQHDNSTYCHIHKLPGDNELPYDYAKNVIQKQADVLISDWKLADRPPIQIGAGMSIFNLEGNANYSNNYQGYQLVSIFLQLSWVTAVFGLVVTFGIKLRQVILAIGTMSFLGFIFINSIFVWPKFFAAGLVVMGCVLLFSRSSKYYSRYVFSALVAIALGMLIHDGVLFTLLGVGAVLCYLFVKDRLHKTKKGSVSVPWRPLLIGGLVAALLLVPWSVYKARNTASDRLIKWHLAGVIIPDDRSAPQTIIDAYTTTPLRTLYQNRVENIRAVAYPMETEAFSSGLKTFTLSGIGIKQSLKHLSLWYQQNDFYTTLFAFGVLNVGWVMVLLKKNRSKITATEKSLLAASAITLVFWILVMFLPRSTVLHQGSYATVLITCSLLAAWIARYNFLTPLFILQWLLFCVFWVFGIFGRYDMSLHDGLPAFGISFIVAALFLGLAWVAPKLPVEPVSTKK